MTLAPKQVAAPFSWSKNDGVPVLQASLAGAQVAFSTRVGGLSAPPYDGLNLGVLTDDDPAHVARNFDRLADALARPTDSIAVGHQVHGTHAEVHRSRPGGPSGPLVEADIQIGTGPEVTPLVLVADCLPVAIANSGAVAMVHCGWRGIAAGILPRAVQALLAVSSSDPPALEAAIGPGIGPCCYEVGREVLDAFRARGHDPDRMLDLVAAVRAELERCGLHEQRIVASGLCTSCNPKLFFSHRHDGPATGRQAGLAWLNS